MSDITVGSEWIDDSDGDILKILAVEGVVLRAESKDEGLCTVLASDLLRNYRLKIKEDDEVADMVNHPPHYKDASGIECYQVTDLMMFNAASCFKYLYRCGNKWDDIEDLEKAVWYAKRAYLTGDNEQPSNLEWDNNIKAIASYREGGIYKAMTAIRSYSWLAVAGFISGEIARLESEQ